MTGEKPAANRFQYTAFHPPFQEKKHPNGCFFTHGNIATRQSHQPSYFWKPEPFQKLSLPSEFPRKNRLSSGSSMVRILVAAQVATELSGISQYTTALAPILQLFPILTLPIIFAPAPI